MGFNLGRYFMRRFFVGKAVKNSWERVLTTLRHTEPDRVPLDIGSTYVTGIMLKPYRELIAYLGIEEEVEVCDIKQQIAAVSETVRERLGVRFPSGALSRVLRQERGVGRRELVQQPGAGIRGSGSGDRVLLPPAGAGRRSYAR